MSSDKNLEISNKKNTEVRITFTSSFSEYHKRKGFNSLTVSTSVSGGSCCKIFVPKIQIGLPSSNIENFNIFEYDGVTLYITKNLVLKSTISFSYDKMLGREMIEMHGYEIRHCAEN